MSNAPQQNFREFLAERDWTLSMLARALGNGKPSEIRSMIRGALWMGRATDAEIARMAVMLNCGESEIRAALAESAVRPGERDARGRKKVGAA